MKDMLVIFVYNAGTGLFNAVSDWAHKVISPSTYECNLCSLTIVTHIDLYMSIMFSQSPLSRVQREMIAVVVSAANRCEYCQRHHGTALNYYWKNETKVNALRKDINTAGLIEKDRVLCAYARQLTLSPQQFEKTNFTVPLKEAGWSDREILDATLVIAYFNFVNRMVLGLGVKLESEGASGYKY